jgi:hypothetical protein
VSAVVAVHPTPVGIEAALLGRRDERVQELPDVAERHVDERCVGALARAPEGAEVARPGRLGPVLHVPAVLDDVADGLTVAVVDVGLLELLPASLELVTEAAEIVDIDHGRTPQAHIIEFLLRHAAGLRRLNRSLLPVSTLASGSTLLRRPSVRPRRTPAVPFSCYGT